jgi:hypothetical protein
LSVNGKLSDEGAASDSDDGFTVSALGDRVSGPARENDGAGAAAANDGAATAYDGALTAYDGALTAYDGALTAYDGALTAYDGALTAYDGALTAYDGVTANAGVTAWLVTAIAGAAPSCITGAACITTGALQQWRQQQR